MCLIVYKPDDKATFSNNKFKIASGVNGDGLGIMFVEDGRVNVIQSIGSEKDQLRLFKQFKNKERYALHLRYATSGLTDVSMCHPFEVLNKTENGIDLWMMHNGIITETANYNDEASDTWHFVNLYLKPLLEADSTLIHNQHIKDMISKYIGQNNKLLFMDSDANVVMINEKQGYTVDGCWLSNTYSITNQYNYNYRDYDYDDIWPPYNNTYSAGVSRSFPAVSTDTTQLTEKNDKAVTHPLDTEGWSTNEDLIEVYITRASGEKEGIEQFYEEFRFFPETYDEDLLEVYMEEYGVDAGMAKFYEKFGNLPENYNYDGNVKEIEGVYERIEDKVSMIPVARKPQEDTITIHNFYKKTRSEMYDYTERYPEQVAELLLDLGDQYELWFRLNSNA